MPAFLRSSLGLCWLAAAGCHSSPPAAEAISSPSAVPAEMDADTDHAAEAAEHQVAEKPVTATLRLSPGRAKSGATLALSVTLQIAPPWEIHPLNAEPASAATQLELTLPDGLQADDSWTAPDPVRSASPDGHPAYAAEVVFKKQVTVTPAAAAGAHRVDCQVTFTACDERRCLSPTPVSLSVPLHIEDGPPP